MLTAAVCTFYCCLYLVLGSPTVWLYTGLAPRQVLVVCLSLAIYPPVSLPELRPALQATGVETVWGVWDVCVTCIRGRGGHATNVTFVLNCRPWDYAWSNACMGGGGYAQLDTVNSECSPYLKDDCYLLILVVH